MTAPLALAAQDGLSPGAPFARAPTDQGRRLPVRAPRDLFPLPELEVEHLQDRSVGRSVQRRLLKRGAVDSEFNQTIRALNAIDGHFSASRSTPSMAQ